jgi:replicative DNA helicase
MSPDGAYRSDSRIEQLRVPPQSVEAEQAVLGGLMLAPDAYAMVADLLRMEDFYRRDHELIFRAITEMAEADPPKPYDAVTLGEWFESKGLSEQVAGGAYLVELASTTPSAANIRAYAEIVVDKSLLRRMIEIGTEIVNNGFQPEGRDSAHLVADASSKIGALTQQSNRDGGLRMIRAGLNEAFEDAVHRNSGAIDCGLPLPWSNARELIPGLEPTDFVVLAARPGMGKTTLALEIVDYIADVKQVNTAIFSLEMGRKQLLGKMIAHRANVDFSKMRKRDGLNDEEWGRISDAKRELAELPIAIDDTVSLTMNAITARAARMHRKVAGGLGLIVIDYLQLIEGSGREEKRHEVVREISRGCKVLAKLLNCTVIALSQLNRGLEGRTDKRPVMADLRESGAIEQDADIIVFIHRDGYYSKDECNAPDAVEFIVGKQRLGPTGTAYLRANLATGRTTNWLGKPNYRKAKQGAKNDGLDDDELPLSGRDRAAGHA